MGRVPVGAPTGHTGDMIRTGTPTSGPRHLAGRFLGSLSPAPPSVADEIWTFFGSGTNLQELYISPHLLTPVMWDELASAALKIMEDRRITSLFICDDRHLEGIVHLHDLWRLELF